MSLLNVALSSVAAISNSMILSDAQGINIQPARKTCPISAESLLNLSGIHAQSRRFGCAFSVAYAFKQAAENWLDVISEKKFNILNIYIIVYYSLTCAHCGENFTIYGNTGRKFCSSACYQTARRKVMKTESPMNCLAV